MVWQLYWVMKLDSIRGFLYGLATGIIVVGAIGSVACMLSFIVYCVNKSDGYDTAAESAIRFSKAMRAFPFIVFPFAIMLFLAHALIPSTKQMAAIEVIPQVVNAVSASETIQKLPDKILNLADEWVNELSPKKSDEANESN